VSTPLTPSATGRPLRLALRVDAVASAACAPVLVFGAGPVSGPLGLPHALLVTAGLLLLPIAVFMWLSAAAPTVRPAAVSAVLAINVLWILGSVAVVLVASPSPWGVAFVLAQAAAVAAILVTEALTLRRSGGGTTAKGAV
jgi:hypothetical protein